MGRDEKIWLVKSGGVILGPLARHEVSELLRNREIGFLDEVSSPLRRWQPIEVHPEFNDIVEAARHAALSETTQVGDYSHTPAMTQTISMTSGLTEEITNDLDGFTPTQREIVVHDVSEQVTVTSPTGGRFQPRGLPQTAVQRKVEATGRWFWVIAVVILIGVALLVIRQRLVNAPAAVAGPEQIRRQVQEAIEVGSSAEALKILRATDLAQSGDLAFYYGTLLIQAEGQTLLGRRMVSPFAAVHRPEAKMALTSLAIADLIDGQADSAEQNLNRALSIDPEYPPALVNKASLFVLRGQFQAAHELAQRLISAGSVEGIVYLVFAEATQGLFASTQNSSFLNEAIQTLRGFQRRSHDYSSEIGLHLLHLESLAKKEVTDEMLAEYLDKDPALTENHRHNVFVYRGAANWGSLGRLCQTVALRLSEGALANTFRAACRERSGKVKEAGAFIEKAVSQAPTDPLVQAWYSIILRSSGQAEQASVVLGRAGEANRRGQFSLPLVLQARFCQQNGDWDCAHESWQKLYERNLEDINAIAGLANLRARKKLLGEARKTLDLGLRLAPDFIPLLKLQLQASKEKW